MPVWADGQTVKGCKIEQFADAFHRVLGVREVRRVRSGLASDAAPNRPNPPNPQSTERDALIPLLGDLDYLDFIAARHREGHLTTGEALDLEHLHRHLSRPIA
jgi:hypothetical protein